MTISKWLRQGWDICARCKWSNEEERFKELVEGEEYISKKRVFHNHHTIPRCQQGKGGEWENQYKEYIGVIIKLCQPCHNKIHSKMRKDGYHR